MVTMKNGRRNTLNWEADRRFGDPTAVSDPACWISGQLAESLRTTLPERIAMFRYAPKYQVDKGFDISGNVNIGDDGKLYLKI
jgi:hypothetical protein